MKHSATTREAEQVAINVACHVFLKYLGIYGNEASLKKIGHAMGISKGAVNEC